MTAQWQEKGTCFSDPDIVSLPAGLAGIQRRFLDLAWHFLLLVQDHLWLVFLGHGPVWHQGRPAHEGNYFLLDISFIISYYHWHVGRLRLAQATAGTGYGWHRLRLAQATGPTTALWT